jgi:phage terminase Nu1 subunit (DNA packaging protein)
MEYQNEFFTSPDPRAAIPRGRGSGDKSRVGRKSDAVREDADYIDYARAKARRETALADIAELEAAKLQGKQVDRDAVRNGSAKAFSTCAQSIRSIPDTLERRLGLPPDVIQAIEGLIDETMAQLSEDLEKVCNHGLE